MPTVWCGYTNFTLRPLTQRPVGRRGDHWSGHHRPGHRRRRTTPSLRAMDRLLLPDCSGRQVTHNVRSDSCRLVQPVSTSRSPDWSPDNPTCKAWIKWEFRGHQPTPVAVLWGIDPTGQKPATETPGPSIGCEQIAQNVTIHEISPTLGDLRAQGSTISLWLRGQSANHDPSFMFYVRRCPGVQTSGTPLPHPGHADQISVTTDGGLETPAKASFTVRNSGVGTLNYTISDNATLLSETPTAAPPPVRRTHHHPVQHLSLAAGTYNATITVSDPNAGKSANYPGDVDGHTTPAATI